jgi:hypothetical protein
MAFVNQGDYTYDAIARLSAPNVPQLRGAPRSLILALVIQSSDRLI